MDVVLLIQMSLALLALLYRFCLICCIHSLPLLVLDQCFTAENSVVRLKLIFRATFNSSIIIILVCAVFSFSPYISVLINVPEWLIGLTHHGILPVLLRHIWITERSLIVISSTWTPNRAPEAEDSLLQLLLESGRFSLELSMLSLKSNIALIHFFILHR